MNIKVMTNAIGLMTLLMFFVSPTYGSEFKRTVIQVSGMHCGSCLRVIDAELRKMPGVVGMTAVFREEKVTVDHEAAVTSEEITSKITDLGYPASVISFDLVSEGSLNRFERAGFGSGSGCCNPGGTSPVAESWREMRRRFFKGRGRGQGGFRKAPEGSE